MHKITYEYIGNGYFEVKTKPGYAFVLYGWHGLKTISYCEIVPIHMLKHAIGNIKKI